MNQVLLLTRGIPASGKTTFAMAWILAGENRVRINRDDIRFMMFGRYHDVNEKDVSRVQHTAIATALKAGKSVVVDDTNLTPAFVQKLVEIGMSASVKVEVKDFDVDLAEALRRNSLRDRKVPEDVIRKMYDRYKNRKPVDLNPFEMRPYVPNTSAPPAIMVDIDGTLAKMRDRSPYEWHRVGEDSLVAEVAEVVNWADQAGYVIVVLSGRDGSCLEQTSEWLTRYEIPYDYLHMRAAGDQRKDSIVKYELFDTFVRDFLNVKFVLDDRNQVVEMWRSIGLTVFQVADGDF